MPELGVLRVRFDLVEAAAYGSHHKALPDQFPADCRDAAPGPKSEWLHFTGADAHGDILPEFGITLRISLARRFRSAPNISLVRADLICYTG
jgi:hypothetical protein